MPKAPLALSLLAFLLSSCGWKTIPINPAQKVELKTIELDQKQAKKSFRSALISVLSEDIKTTQAENIHKFLSPQNYVGAQSNNNKNSVFFLYRYPDFMGSDYFRKMALFVDIGKGAKMEIFSIPPNTTSGLFNHPLPPSYALIISNSSLCRAYFVDEVRGGNFWSFSTQKNLSSSACYGKTAGSISTHVPISRNAYSSLETRYGRGLYTDFLVIEHTEIEKLQDLATIFRATFSNIE